MPESQSNRRSFLALAGSTLLSAATSASVSGCSDAQAADSSAWNITNNPQVTALGPNGAQITGYCAPAYKPVFDAFVANFQQRQEIGASVAVTVKGTPVLEAWGGFSDALATTPSVPWNRDTVSLVFSCTKAATAICAHMLAAQGMLDLDKPVAFYWPEFAANGKSAITVRVLMQHAAGLAAIPFSSPIPLGGWADWSLMTSTLAAQAPWWEPGTAHGYHALTYGWLVGEVVRRVSGVSVGTFFQNQVAAPLGMDFWIGMPSSQLGRQREDLETEKRAKLAAGVLGLDMYKMREPLEKAAWRDDRRVARLLKAAKLKVSAACVEDINWRASRSLDRSLVATLAGGDWLRHAKNLLITGATGCGKTWLACALAHQAARSGFSVLYTRAARLFDELQVAHGDGSFARRLVHLAKLDLLVIDDFAISPMGPAERNDLLEVLDDRVGSRSTLITSQLPVKAWHTYLDDPTLADAILDRVVHSSHKIELKGKSLRDNEQDK